MFRCKAVAILCVCVVALSSLCYSQTKEELQIRKKEIQSQIKATNTLIVKAKREKTQSLSTLSAINQQIRSREEMVSMLSLEVKLNLREIQQLKTEIEQTEFDIAAQEALIDTLKKEYAFLIQNAYYNRNAYNRLAFIFTADSYRQALKRLRYLQEYSQFREKQVEKIKSVEQQLAQNLLQLKQQKALLMVAKNERQTNLEASRLELTLLTQEKDSQNQLLTSLKRKEKQLKKDLIQQQRLADDLTAQIKKIIADEIRKAKEKANASAGSSFSLTPEQQQLSDEFSSNKGKLPWPVERGVIVERFGIQPHPVLKGIETLNNGIKIMTDKGTNVRAIFEGSISRIIDLPGSGKAIIISHGDYFSVYSGLSEVYVKRGQKVALKEDIASVLTKSSSQESITELQIWKGSEKMDPSNWLYSTY